LTPGAPIARRLFRAASLASLLPELGVRRGLEYRRLVRRQPPDRGRTVYELIWRDAADALGAELVDEGEGTFSVHRDGRTVAVRNLVTPIDDRATIDYSLDKPAVAAELAKRGIPVPVNLEFRARELSRARRFLAEHRGPCVVKPAGGFAGLGVTCGVRTQGDLFRATLAAAAYDARLIVERQVPGEVYRLLFLDGVLLDVVRRRPAQVTGDGSSTVLALIAAENRRRVEARGFAGLTLIRPDLDCILALRAAGLGPRQIPADGVRFAVRTANGDGGAADTESVDPVQCEAIVRDAAAACEVVGARLAGVDVATSDLGLDLRTAGGAVIEVNVPPGLHFHYLVADRSRATPVAVPILRRLLDG
jgi:D-alanine-D-alanine ligase-like ATP-grasp enzyme